VPPTDPAAVAPTETVPTAPTAAPATEAPVDGGGVAAP